MSENTEKLKAEITENFRQLFGDGVSHKDKARVQKYFSIYVQQKINGYYNGKEKDAVGLNTVIQEIFGEIKEASADSKAEIIMYEALTEAGILFQFQYKIGPFRVDFLIGDSFVFELDGPLHVLNPEYDAKRKKYIESKGYTVLAVPLWVAMFDKQAVVERIADLAQGIGKG